MLQSGQRAMRAGIVVGQQRWFAAVGRENADWVAGWQVVAAARATFAPSAIRESDENPSESLSRRYRPDAEQARGR